MNCRASRRERPDAAERQRAPAYPDGVEVQLACGLACRVPVPVARTPRPSATTMTGASPVRALMISHGGSQAGLELMIRRGHEPGIDPQRPRPRVHDLVRRQRAGVDQRPTLGRARDPRRIGRGVGDDPSRDTVTAEDPSDGARQPLDRSRRGWRGGVGGRRIGRDPLAYGRRRRPPTASTITASSSPATMSPWFWSSVTSAGRAMRLPPVTPPGDLLRQRQARVGVRDPHDVVPEQLAGDRLPVASCTSAR